MKQELKQVTAEEVVGLRHRILRAELPRGSAIFSGDELAATLHCAAYLDGQMVSCLTLMLSEWEGAPAWQLRGMATDESRQKSGVGRSLVQYAIGLARVKSPEIILFWCNARVTAIGFYEKLGWRVVSEAFEVPTAGPHVRMLYRAPD